MKLRIAAPAILACAFLMANVAPASAHASLDRATPAVGSAVRGSPAEVRLWFTSEIEEAFSTVKVFDASGNRVDKLDRRSDPSDRRVLSISLADVKPGKYRVEWRVVSVDTHVTKGDFTFTVEP